MLYIGITRDPRTRWTEHSQARWWFRKAASCSAEEYATRAEALAAEDAAITSEWPPGNRWHPVGPPDSGPNADEYRPRRIPDWAIPIVEAWERKHPDDGTCAWCGGARAGRLPGSATHVRGCPYYRGLRA